MTWVITGKMRFYLHDEESLLDGLIRTGHHVEYQCREGYCGSCRMRCLSSSHQIDYPISPLAVLDADEILPCCCRVQGVISIHYVPIPNE